MLFNEIITHLQKGESIVKDYTLKTNPEINNCASLDDAISKEISFIEMNSYLSKNLEKTNASALIIPDDLKLIEKLNAISISFVIVNNPRIAFAECLEFLNPQIKPKSEIHQTAVIGEGVEIGEDVFIGPNVCIGNMTKIGNGVIIHSGVVIYEKVVIGDENELHANCVIHPHSKLGNQCVIHSNAVIGSEGFGFIPSSKGWRKMPQTGSVILEDQVEIGSGSMVDRPAVGETRIGEGTKIDNLVQIGHGVTTGRACAMASQVGIAGGANIGNGVILAGQVGVGNRVSVGDRVIASSKCGIHADIEPGEVISGFPAISNKLWLRCSANFKKLPEIAKGLKDLAKKSSNSKSTS